MINLYDHNDQSRFPSSIIPFREQLQESKKRGDSRRANTSVIISAIHTDPQMKWGSGKGCWRVSSPEGIPRYLTFKIYPKLQSKSKLKRTISPVSLS